MDLILALIPGCSSSPGPANKTGIHSLILHLAYLLSIWLLFFLFSSHHFCFCRLVRHISFSLGHFCPTRPLWFKGKKRLQLWWRRWSCFWRSAELQTMVLFGHFPVSGQIEIKTPDQASVMLWLHVECFCLYQHIPKCPWANPTYDPLQLHVCVFPFGMLARQQRKSCWKPFKKCCWLFYWCWRLVGTVGIRSALRFAR